MAEQASANDTIVATATAVGAGAVGIVRLSGPEAISIAESAFKYSHARAGGVGAAESFSLAYGHVVDPATLQVLDEVLLAVMRSPRSYTREDVVEWHCHGGAMAVRSILRLMVALGARLAEPGEFTRRAFVNGRIDLVQAESVAAIVAARSSGALRASLRQLEGGLSDRVRKVRADLMGTLAVIAASVDFSDEDVDEVDWAAAQKTLEHSHARLEELLSTALLGRALEEGVRTAIVGRPNAGKSSLLNALLMRERAIVSETPGTTRDTVEEELEIGGMPFRLVDTAGLRSGGDPVERMGIDRSFKALQHADLVLLVLDLAGPVGADELAVLAKGEGELCIVVGNKLDLVGDPQAAMERLSKQVHSFQQTDCLPRSAEKREVLTCAVSALTGEGVEDLRVLIGEAVAGGGVRMEDPVLASERQRVLVGEAAARLHAALEAVALGRGEELICEDVRAAAEALGRVTGEDFSADLLDEIFGRFCLGK